MDEKYFSVALLNKRTGYDPEVMREMFEYFSDSYTEYFDVFQKAIEEEDWKRLSETAHRAKSSVAIMGMESIRQDFNELELLAEKGQETGHYKSRIDDLRKRVEMAVRQIQEYLETHA
ncbi:MAG: Hpt domain-containing protein [Bacteroidota bacterium]